MTNRLVRKPRSAAATFWWSARGLPGLSAAIAAAEAGADVVVLDERSATGGQYAKPLADSHADAAPDAQFRLGTQLRENALTAGAGSKPTQQFGAPSQPTKSPLWCKAVR